MSLGNVDETLLLLILNYFITKLALLHSILLIVWRSVLGNSRSVEKAVDPNIVDAEINLGPIAYKAGDATRTNCDLEVNSDKVETKAEAEAESEAKAETVHHESARRQGLMEVQVIFGATIATLIGKVSLPLNSFYNDFTSPSV